MRSLLAIVAVAIALVAAFARQFHDAEIRCLDTDEGCGPTDSQFKDDEVEEPGECQILSPDDIFPWEENEDA